MKTLVFAAASAAAMCCATMSHAATPITYTDSLTIGSSSVSFSLTTDGTLGEINAGNLVGWDITLSDGIDTFNLTNANSTLSMTATLLATVSSLVLPYIEGSSNNEIGFRLSPGWTRYYSVGGGSIFNYAFGQHIMLPSGVESSLTTQDIVLGTAGGDVAGAVPEPATWAMMLLGFGLVGGAVRAARRKQTVKVTYA